MPEGHTIHRHAATHQRLFRGQQVAVSSPQGRFGDAALLDGATFRSAEAHGKHFFAWFDVAGAPGDEPIGVHVHLGLFGKWRVHRSVPPPEPQGQVRLRIVGAKAATDLSGPTACDVVTTDGRDAVLARLGPDPIRTDQDPQRFLDRVARSRTAIGLLLMDQSVIAGVGNVYRAEALFVNGIHPERPGRELDPAERDALWATSVAMLRQGVKDGRIITVDPTELGIPKSALKRDKATYVYKREHCLRCGTPVRRWDLSGRWCYCCETCQPRG